MFQVVGKLETKYNSLTVSVKRHRTPGKVENTPKKIRIIQNETPPVISKTPVQVVIPKKTSTPVPVTLTRASVAPISTLIAETVSPRRPQQVPQMPQIATNAVVKTESAERKFWCFPCNIAYSYKNLLLKHLNTIHGVALLKCDFCNEHFADSAYRERHITQVHIRFPTETPQQIPTEDVNEENEEMYDEQVEWLEQDNDEEYEVKVEPDPPTSDDELLDMSQSSQFSVSNSELSPLREKMQMRSKLTMYGNKKGRPTKEMVQEWKKRRLERQEKVDEGAEGDVKNEEWWAQPKDVPDPKKYGLKDRARMCHICGEMKVSLSAHLRKVHTEFKNCPTCSGKIYEGETSPHKCYTRRPTYLCSCGVEYNVREHMHGHMLEKNSTKHEIQCINCEATFRDFLLYHEHQDEAHPSPFLCNVCGKQFNKKANLKSHMYSIHVMEKPIIKCEICGAECKGTRNHKRHVMYVHRKATRINCEICNISIFDKISLRRHMNYKHGLKKEFVCNVCKKDFATADALRYHLTIHTGDRPYPCPFCPKSFKINSELRKHYRAHKELTVKCPSCSLYCLNEEDLRKHIRRFPSHDITHVYVEEVDE